MCNVQSPNTRALIIEVLENGKVSLPPFIHTPEATLTIEELLKCRDYLDLIIANPDNFHIVGDGFKSKRRVFCKSCSTQCVIQTEIDNQLCFACEKKKILEQVNKPMEFTPIINITDGGPVLPDEIPTEYTECIGCGKKLGDRNKYDGFCNMCKSKAGK